MKMKTMTRIIGLALIILLMNTATIASADNVTPNREYANQFDFLNQAEKDRLVDTYDKWDVLFEKMNALYSEQGELIRGASEEQVQAIEKDMEALAETIAPIEEKILAQLAKETPYESEQMSDDELTFLDEYKTLSDRDKATLTQVYGQLDALLVQMEGTTQSEEDALWKQYDALLLTIQPIEEKMMKELDLGMEDEDSGAGIEQSDILNSAKLSDAEKAELKDIYAKNDALWQKLEPIASKENPTAEEIKSADELYQQVDQLLIRIAELENKAIGQ